MPLRSVIATLFSFYIIPRLSSLFIKSVTICMPRIHKSVSSAWISHLIPGYASTVYRFSPHLNVLYSGLAFQIGCPLMVKYSNNNSSYTVKSIYFCPRSLSKSLQHFSGSISANFESVIVSLVV